MKKSNETDDDEIACDVKEFVGALVKLHLDPQTDKEQLQYNAARIILELVQSAIVVNLSTMMDGSSPDFRLAKSRMLTVVAYVVDLMETAVEKRLNE